MGTYSPLLSGSRFTPRFPASSRDNSLKTRYLRLSPTTGALALIVCVSVGVLVSLHAGGAASSDFVLYMGYQKHGAPNTASDLGSSRSFLGSLVYPFSRPNRAHSCGSPYSLPGSLRPPGLNEPLSSTHYIVTSPSVSDIPTSQRKDFHVPSLSALVKKDPYNPQLDFARGKSVVVIGDSIDRNAVNHMGLEVFNDHGGHQFLNNYTFPSLTHPSEPGHWIGQSFHKALNLTISNFFMMGLAVTDPVDWWHGGEDFPQRFEKRLSRFHLPAVRKGYVPDPDVVVFSTGLWDLTYFGARHYALEGASAPSGGAPLVPADLSYHRDRLRHFIRVIRQAFPKARLVYRTPHLTSDVQTGHEMGKLRVVEMEGSVRGVVAEFEEVEIMRWGEAVVGFEWEMYEPPHFGRGSAQWVYGDLILEQLRQHVDPKGAEWADCAEYRKLLGAAQDKERLNRGKKFLLSKLGDGTSWEGKGTSSGNGRNVEANFAR